MVVLVENAIGGTKDPSGRGKGPRPTDNSYTLKWMV